MASLANLLINSAFMELGPEVDDRLNRVSDLYERFTGHVDYPVGPPVKQRYDTENTPEEETQ